jgi:hypothetical protein
MLKRSGSTTDGGVTVIGGDIHEIPDYIVAFQALRPEESSGWTVSDFLSVYLGEEELNRRRGLRERYSFEGIHGFSGTQEEERYLFREETCTRNHSFIDTAQGFFGLGPQSSQKGDLVCKISGLSSPIILRKSEDHFVLIGPCFMAGFLDGEKTEALEGTKINEHEFEIW